MAIFLTRGAHERIARLDATTPQAFRAHSLHYEFSHSAKSLWLDPPTKMSRVVQPDYTAEVKKYATAAISIQRWPAIGLSQRMSSPLLAQTQPEE